MNLIKFTLALVSIAFFAVFVKAQDETIRVETNLVTLNVAVKDAKGNYVKGLKVEQFEIFDKEAKQQILHFSSEESAVSFGIVYDMHPTTTERTSAVLDSLRQFTKNLPKKDDFFMLAFNMRGALTTDFIPTLEQLEKQQNSREPNSLYDSIYAAADMLRESRNLKRTLLIISDSADHRSRHSISELRKKLKSYDVQIYAVVFDKETNWIYSDITRDGKGRRIFISDASELERAEIQDLTLKSGGTTEFPVSLNGSRLLSIYQKIAGEMRQQYTLGFYPTNAADGKWHDLKVRLRDIGARKGLGLTYRQGYQSLQRKLP